jgi:hypothetical protein
MKKEMYSKKAGDEKEAAAAMSTTRFLPALIRMPTPIPFHAVTSLQKVPSTSRNGSNFFQNSCSIFLLRVRVKE